MTIQKLMGEIKSNKIFPVYLFIGEENEEKREIIEQIINTVEKESGEIEKYTFYGDEIDASDVIDELETFSFFNYKKVIIVKNAEKIYASKALLSYLTNPNERSILILLSDKSKNDLPSNIQKSVEKVGRVAVFWKNFQDRIERWLMQELIQRKIKTDEEAIKYIIEMTGNEKESLLNQINIISNYIGKDETLNIEKLKKIVSRIVKYSVFDLINSIFLDKPERLVKIFRDLIENGEELTTINFLFWRYLKTLIIARMYKDRGYSNSEIISTLKLKKLESQRILKVISSISIGSFIRLISYLEKIDYLLKTGPKNISIIQFEKMLLSLKKV